MNGSITYNWTHPWAVDDNFEVSIVTETRQIGNNLFYPGRNDESFVFEDGHGNQAECKFTVVVSK